MVPGEGLKPEIGNVETLGVKGHTLGMLIWGGGGAGSETDMAILGDVHIMRRVGEFWDKHWIC